MVLCVRACPGILGPVSPSPDQTSLAVVFVLFYKRDASLSVPWRPWMVSEAVFMLVSRFLLEALHRDLERLKETC
jgi:hypothetical protein